MLSIVRLIGLSSLDFICVLEALRSEDTSDWFRISKLFSRPNVSTDVVC